MKKVFCLLLIVFTTMQITIASQTDTTKIFGVTIDGIDNLSTIVTSLSNLNIKPTTRIVFDEWVPAANYQNAVNQIHNVSFIMGEICDSYYTGQYTLAQYVSKTNEYLNLLGSKVDIWEVGNEVNGEWCGTTSSVVAKIDSAYSLVKAQNKKTELTLYYNKGCYSNSANEMFYWVNHNVSSAMRTGLDYVLISYYEDDCNGLQPNWQRVFDSLHYYFPNSKIGIGECGTTNSSNKTTYINRYYKMHITTPNYVGGYFWWYYKQDCVPYTSSLWSVLNSAIILTSFTPITQVIPNKPYLSANYPNPFNPTTKINYSIPEKSFVKLTIYNILGEEVSTIVNEEKQAGEYTVNFNGSNLSSGAYFYKLSAGNFTDTKKMLLIK